MADCIFCKIIDGSLPCAKVYDDQEIIAFLDIMPINKGHILVVPKQHCETLSDASEKMLATISAALKQISQAVMAGVRADGVNLLLANGRAAGQVVPHLHFHIIPRHEGDGLHFDAKRAKYDNGEMEEYRKKIVAAQ